jgi:hypothetical protein
MLYLSSLRWFSDNYGVWMSTSLEDIHATFLCQTERTTSFTLIPETAKAIGLTTIYAKGYHQGPLYKKESIVIIIMF